MLSQAGSRGKARQNARWKQYRAGMTVSIKVASEDEPFDFVEPEKKRTRCPNIELTLDEDGELLVPMQT